MLQLCCSSYRCCSSVAVKYMQSLLLQIFCNYEEQPYSSRISMRELPRRQNVLVFYPFTDIVSEVQQGVQLGVCTVCGVS